MHPLSWGPVGWTLVLLSFALGFAAFPMRTVGWDFEFLPGDPVDNRLNNYILEHGYRYLTGRVPSFWDAPMFYPSPRATTRSDAHIGMLPIYAALRTLGLSPECAFQGWFLIPFVLNFASCVWAIKRLGFGPIAAAIGAYTFTFPLAVAAQNMHGQLFPRFLIPPAIVFAWEFQRAPTTWRMAAVAACWVGQTYLTVYMGYFLALLLGVGALVSLLRFRSQLAWRDLILPNGRTWLARAAVLALTAIAIFPLARAHGTGVGKLTREHFVPFAPRPMGWITPPVHAATYPEIADYTGLGSHQAAEQQLCPGLTSLLALGICLQLIISPIRLDQRGAAVAVAAWAAVLLAAAVTRYGDWWPYESVIELPGAGGIRAVGRVVFALMFPAAIAVGACSERLAQAAMPLGRGVVLSVALLLLGLVAADQWLAPTEGQTARRWDCLRYSRKMVELRQHQISEAIRRWPGATAVHVFPSATPSGGVAVQTEAMRAAQDLGLPCVNGWSGYSPKDWDYFSYFPNYRSLMDWLTESNKLTPGQLAGLVVVGEPELDKDPIYEAAMREAYPPQLVVPEQ